MPNPVAQLLDRLSSTLAALKEALSSTEAPPKAPRGKKAPRTTTKKTAKRAVAPTAPAPETAASPDASKKPKAPKNMKAPSARLALQGKYMASLRGLSATNKAKVKKVLAVDGVEAAIVFALSKKKG